MSGQDEVTRPAHTPAAGTAAAIDLAALRIEYGAAGLDEDAAGEDPYALFDRWFAEVAAGGIHEPNAMVVATADADGHPSARAVLLKGVRSPEGAGVAPGEDGFVFFTNSASRKGAELAVQAHCSLLFGWFPVERQIRIEGVAVPLPQAEVDAYFASRPRGSQLGAWASAQSRPVPDRAALERAYAEVEQRFADAPVPTPPAWGGYRVRPGAFEFWQGRPGRMHDRIRFRRLEVGRGESAEPFPGSEWVRDRLAP